MSEIKQCPLGYEWVNILVNSKDIDDLMFEWAERRKVDIGLYNPSRLTACQDLLRGGMASWTRVWREMRLSREVAEARRAQEAQQAAAAAAATKAETSAKREPARPASRKKAHRDGQFTRLSDAERLKVATVGAAKIAASIHSTQETVARAVGGHKIRAITAQAIRNELSRGAK